MKLQQAFKGLILACVLMTAAAALFAQPVINARIEGDNYNVGDRITVAVQVSGNPGMHGLYFDLAFDGSVLAFEGLEPGLLVQRVTDAADLLYAASDPATSAASGSHVIVSYFLKGSGAATAETGTLAELNFRVIGPGVPETSYRFVLRNHGIQDRSGLEIAGAQWQNSNEFTIGAPAGGAYLVISSPCSNQVYYVSTAAVNAIFTAGAADYVVVRNLDNGYASSHLPAASGSISAHPVPLKYGFNRIEAALYNSANNALASDGVVVYRSEDRQFITIRKPADHALLNTDVTDVIVASTYAGVKVNGLDAEALGQKYGDLDLYRCRVWLKKGFNTITAETRNPGGAVYRDSIVVYYERNDSVFRFTSPLAGEVFKSAAGTLLNVKGEISSLYRGNAGASGAQAERNTVTLRVIYTPKNPMYATRILVDNRLAAIAETDVPAGQSQVPYMFYNDFEIPLSGLDSGEIEIIAYKNKDRATSENEIHRFVSVDNNRLWINLVQPNIYNSDVLDTPAKMSAFHDPQTPTDPLALSKIRLSNDGSLALRPQDNVVGAESAFAGANKKVVDVIETADGTLFTLINENNALKIYEKAFGTSAWTLAVSRPDMYGYDICETDIGILVGVSNLFSSENSGLYLLQGNKLTNVVIGQPIPHVQFIKNHKGVVYLYGNDYSHLYSFNLYTLEDDGGRLKTSVIGKDSFPNDLFIAQFELSGDAFTAVLRTTDGRVRFYQKTASGYVEHPLDKTAVDPQTAFANVVPGEYLTGNYSAYLLLKRNAADDSACLVMENKTDHRLVPAAIALDFAPGETICGADFKGNDFYFIHRVGGTDEYNLRSGQLAFNYANIVLVTDGTANKKYEAPAGLVVSSRNLRLLKTNRGSYYAGFGEDAPTDDLYCFTSNYPASGAATFNYKNSDIEGISGFSFEVDPLRLSGSDISIGFTAGEASGVPVIPTIGLDLTGLSQLVTVRNDYFKVEKQYDAALRKEIIYVTFANLLADNRYLAFSIDLKAIGNFSPEISNFTVYKKVPVKLPRSTSQYTHLPIHGFIYDPTVKEVYISALTESLKLERDGSFTCNYGIISTEKVYPMEISCTNGAGQSVSLKFNVELFESQNGLYNVVIADSSGAPIPVQNGNEYVTSGPAIKVSGEYFGLCNAETGYELYAYDYADGSEKLVLLRRGIFEKHVDGQLDPAYASLGSGYETGYFQAQTVNLTPGKQRLIIYVENPGGVKGEFLADPAARRHPDVVYNLAVGDQKVLITNIDRQSIAAYAYDGAPVDEKIALELKETPNAPYLFTRTYVVHGEIRSLYKLTDLKIKSYSQDVAFENGAAEITVPVDKTNGFQVTLTMTLPEECESRVYHLSFTPTPPFLSYMKKALRLEAAKYFGNTRVVPDFKPCLDGPRWTAAEIRSKEKAVRAGISRFVPAGARLNLLVNYEKDISGELVKVNPGESVYKLVESADKPQDVKLTGVKYGLNRVQWRLVTRDGLTISSSTQSGMEDFTFTLTEPEDIKPTIVNFPLGLQTYYDVAASTTPLPAIILQRDPVTKASVFLNGARIWSELNSTASPVNGVVTDTISLYSGTIIEGRNHVAISYTEGDNNPITADYSFLFDSKIPEVKIASTTYTSNYEKLASVTALVTEANLDKVALYQGIDPMSVINIDPVVTYIEDGIFKVTWIGIQDYNPPLGIVPTAANPVRVQAVDHAGKISAYAAFNGVSGTVPRDESGKIQGVAITLDPQKHEQHPYFPSEDGYSHPFHSEFNEHNKFYNANIEIRNFSVQPSASVRFERHNSITMDGTVAVNGGNLTLRAGTLPATGDIGFKSGFRVAPGGQLSVQNGQIGLDHPADGKFQHTESSDAISFVFWFRYDQEDYYAPDANVFRKILTVYENIDDSNPDEPVYRRLYLAYKDINGTPASGDEYLYLVEEVRGFSSTNPQFIQHILIGEPQPLPISSAGRPHDWNCVVLSFDTLTETIHLSVNGLEPLSLPVAALQSTILQADFTDVLQNIVAQDLTGDEFFYFGENASFDDEEGHFSIDQALYTNRLINYDDLPDVIVPAGQTFVLPENNPRREYHFNDAADGVGEEHFKLRITGPDAFEPKENVGFSQAAGRGGSLKASRQERNFLKIAGDGSVIFHDAVKYYTTNLNANVNAENGAAVLLTPTATSAAGRYFFGNNFSSHGVVNDPYYSVIGEIVAAEAGGEKRPVDARLVVRVNNVEQSMALQEGRFHFIYKNNNLTPTSIIMYIEARQPVLFKKNIRFIEGNYDLPLPPTSAEQTLYLSYAATKYVFYTEGTIQLWYKPFIVNDRGFVNYPAVLFDSEYLQLGTKKLPGKDYVGFYAYIHPDTAQSIPAVSLDGNVPVTGGWQHLQFSYRLSEDGENDIAYLYVNGRLAAFQEGLAGRSDGFPRHGGMTGAPLVSDNVHLGASASLNRFAEGYIDDVAFNSIYAGPLYDQTVNENDILVNPLVVSYTETSGPALDISANGISDSDVTECYFVLTSRDGLYRKVSQPAPFMSGKDHHGFDVASLASGPYILKAEAKIRGRRHQTSYSFTKNDKPRFAFKSATPLIIRGLESDLSFTVGYDDSYAIAARDTIFSGMAVTIHGETNGAPFDKTIYVTQDYYYTQDKTKWLVFTRDDIEPQPLTVSGNALTCVFDNITSVKPVAWEMHSFYFDASIDVNDLTLGATARFASGTIPDAALSVDIVTKEFTVGDKKETIEYKLAVAVGSGEGSGGEALFSQLGIGYRVTSTADPTINAAGEFGLDADGRIDIYYDDILPAYGIYACVLSLKYNGETYSAQEETLTWKKITEQINYGETKSLDIVDFSLLTLDRKTAKAQVYLQYEENNISEEIRYEISVISALTNEKSSYSGSLSDFQNPEKYAIFTLDNIREGLSYVVVNLKVDADGIYRHAEFTLSNISSAPEVLLTNTVPSLIAYNNVMFSWRGFHEGAFKPDIAYSYNFDGKGWTTPNSAWRDVEFFGLADGYHNFRVKALYDGKESPEASVTFFVDVNKPAFDQSKITVQKIYDEENILYAVNILGREGAVGDASLASLTLDGRAVAYAKDGSFSISELLLAADGRNEFKLTALDKVGNFSDFAVTVENNLTQVLFPNLDNVRYSPMTLVGKIDSSINARLSVYLFDPSSRDTGARDFSGWKKARINEDRVFFIEDVAVNPGTAEREAVTPLTLAVVTDSGKIFKRELAVKANDVLRPIDMVLSTHAAEGQTAETSVTVDCKANAGDISSWSIDFDGDGIYDDVAMVDNQLYGKEKTWSHTYSAIGLVRPRVRVITLDGNYFSVSDEIVIHEKITQSSPVLVNDPISMSIAYLPDGSERVFLLAGANNAFRVEVYEIGRNMSYVSDKLFTVSLAGFGIENPVKILALGTDCFYVAENRAGRGNVYVFKANATGNYLPVAGSQFQVFDAIRDMDADSLARTLYLTLVNYNTVVTVPLADKLPLANQQSQTTPEMFNASPLGGNLGIAKDLAGVYLSDFFNQRIVKLTETLKAEEYFGSFGNGEAEFIKPALIATHLDRTFVYDEGRFDVQVFGPDAGLVTTVAYNPAPGYANYLESDFLANIADIGVVTKEEGGRLYYYLLLLSKSREKLAMLRLPQWEEFRARVRNNRIVFLKDREVYTAKPTGSDLKRIVSSDSFPRVEGMLDYPALSPDGRRVVFTSRIGLYDGVTQNPETDPNAYDNLYVVDVKDSSLTRVPLGVIDNFEIERPVFNSNGDKIVFSAKTKGGFWQLYTYNFETGGVVRLFSSTENARFPAFSPDDRYVVFNTDNDGDQDLEIFDTANPTIRVVLTNNAARDSYPVWSSTYPFEISNPDLHIDSKIGFVSERSFRKGLYYTYIARPSESDLRVVTKSGQETGNDPDAAAVEITTPQTEGDYPAFTGDGKSVVFEYNDGGLPYLRKYLFETNEFAGINLPSGSRKPAGMKNTIANFQAEPVNGDEVKLSWTPYTDQDTFYYVEFRKNKEGEISTLKKVFTQNGTTIKGLEMGVEYLFRAFIKETQAQAEPDASSQWKKVLMPKVAARATYEFDPTNPYLVKLHAWKPKPETEWEFSWIIDNQEIKAGPTQDYYYEFGTSGQKTILLKAADKSNTYVSVSEPLIIDVVSDIHPVIHYSLADDASYIELDASKTAGAKIDWAATAWIVSGPGAPPTTPTTGSKTIIYLDNFRHKINVNLTVRRTPVTGQPATDVIERNLSVDLDFADVKAVITYEIDEADARVYRFSGDNSLGNIDWLRARWYVYGDGVELHREDSASSFAFRFPASGTYQNYTVSLTVPKRSDGTTETTTIVVNVEPAPLEPVIDYEILTLKEGTNVVGAKILFSCSNSKGSSIDFAQTRWSVPVAGSYGEQPTQTGPTAIYNLFGVNDNAIVEVSLTLFRRTTGEAVTVTRLINVKSGQVAGAEIIVNKTIQKTNTGKVLVLDVLSSTGPNIDWEKTQWLIDNQYSRTGPAVRIDVPASAEDMVVTYACTLYRYGETPLTKVGNVVFRKSVVKPVIAVKKLSGGNGLCFMLDVLDTPGVNIDWERTMWYIFDGSQSTVQKQGAQIMHTFVTQQNAMGYPIMVTMFYKGSSSPFVGYMSLDVEGDDLIPVITCDQDETKQDAFAVYFSAESSQGYNIDWTQTKWTFGDSSEAQYGPVVMHKYTINSTKREYKVSLTIFRRLANGAVESKTAYKTIKLDGDKIKSVIKAAYYTSDSYMMLSCEDSEGIGLLLDRSSWLFPGEGDSQSYAETTQDGLIQHDSYSASVNESQSFGVEFGFETGGGFMGIAEASAKFSTSTSQTFGAGFSYSTDTTSYDGYISRNMSFSSSNIHTGAVCRRYVTTKDVQNGYIIATLFVFRMRSDGIVEGESITVKIDLSKATVTADKNGVTYGK